MINPWLEIPSADYENHMTGAGQLGILGKEFKNSLREFQPESVTVLGAATGNGFDHINPLITKTIHAIDINPEFLHILNSRYGKSLPGMEIHLCNIVGDVPEINGSELVFAALIFEYTNIVKALSNTSRLILNDGKLVSIIQINEYADFVSKSQYKSLEKLGNFSNEVNTAEFISIARDNQLELLSKQKIEVSPGKYFEKLTMRKTG